MASWDRRYVLSSNRAAGSQPSNSTDREQKNDVSTTRLRLSGVELFFVGCKFPEQPGEESIFHAVGHSDFSFALWYSF